ncbi:MAG: chromosomal replication initiator protein DnaA [Fusobacteria bacterium]|nr:chromosomal replication initiator protein DnaA [Fusobacteriota bacterium]
MENNAEKLWNSILKIVSQLINEVDYNSWLKNVTPKKFEDNKLIISVENIYQKNKILNYIDKLEEALNTIMYDNEHVSTIDIEVVEKDNLKNTEKFDIPEKNHDYEYGKNYYEEKKTRSISLFNGISNNLNKKHIFENFVVGKSNELAHAAAEFVSNKPENNAEKSKYNPLFINGDVGLGKTHLMHAIGNRFLEIDDNKKIFYCSSEQFTNDLINSINKGKMMEFRAKYRKLDLLLIDDIQFLAGKDSTQEEFFHTFNELHQDGKQIVISSDRPPKDISNVEKRLISRFEWGLTVDIQQPDYETRVAILRKKAEIDKIKVSENVLRYIAETINSNIRELEGALNQIIARASLLRKEVTIDLVQEVFLDEKKSKSRHINEEKILEKVAEHYNATLDEIKSKSRKKEIAVPRQVAMYFIRTMLDKPFKEIGNLFSGRDHSTVMHSVDKIEKDIKLDKNFEKDINLIKDEIMTN